MVDNSSSPASQPQPTSLDKDYAERLVRKQTAWWKRLIDVQAPYRWNLRRLRPGFTLEIGCGIGRNLMHLRGQSVGVDPNEHAIATAKSRGLTAFTPAEFRQSEYCQPERFDTLLLAHVCEHLGQQASIELVREYLSLLKPAGHIILITPQEAGYRSDATHVEFMDTARLRSLLETLGLSCDQAYSFPFPRWVGKWFTYNEFVVVGKKLTDAISQRPSLATR